MDPTYVHHALCHILGLKCTKFHSRRLSVRPSAVRLLSRWSLTHTTLGQETSWAHVTAPMDPTTMEPKWGYRLGRRNIDKTLKTHGCGTMLFVALLIITDASHWTLQATLCWSKQAPLPALRLATSGLLDNLSQRSAMIFQRLWGAETHHSTTWDIRRPKNCSFYRRVAVWCSCARRCDSFFVDCALKNFYLLLLLLLLSKRRFCAKLCADMS